MMQSCACAAKGTRRLAWRGRRMLSQNPAALRRDPYAVLGVEPPVGSAALKAAFRERALETHPDRNMDGDRAASERAFKDLNDAYQNLSANPRKRQAVVDKYGEAFPSIFWEVLGVRKQHSEHTLDHLTRALMHRLYGPMEDFRLT